MTGKKKKSDSIKKKLNYLPPRRRLRRLDLSSSSPPRPQLIVVLAASSSARRRPQLVVVLSSSSLSTSAQPVLVLDRSSFSAPRRPRSQHLLFEDRWEKCWEEGVTPWDLGQATPVVLHLLQTGTLPKGRVLVPGCGTGYDVVAMASADRHVLGLDISSSAVRKAKEWSSSLPNANYFNFLAEDFFAWQPSGLFDLIFDYTFFCAIDPCMRSSWAKKMNDILKPDGELITLIYLMNDQERGPPYNNSVADYEEVLNLVGFTAVSIVDNELAIAPRRGKEKLGRWKRCLHHSSL